MLYHALQQLQLLMSSEKRTSWLTFRLGMLAFSFSSIGVDHFLPYRSTELFSALNALKYDINLRPHILDVRGRGLMVGVEFASPPPPSSPTTSSPVPPTESVSDSGPGAHNASTPANMASRVAARCIEKGMLILTTSVYQVIRFIPPLNVSKADLAKGCQIFAEAVREVVKEG